MAKSKQTPGTVLSSLLDEYQLNPNSLAKAINLSQSGVRQIITGKSKLSVPTALRLSKYFGETPEYWLDLQRNMDLNEAANDTELQSVLQGITKIRKPTAKGKTKAKESTD
jgi:addiction module HigA family antidote